MKTLRNMNAVLMYVIMGLLYKYIYTQKGLQIQEPQITNRLRISPKLIHLTSCLWQKNPDFRKNSLCSLIWPDFDPFDSTD